MSKTLNIVSAQLNFMLGDIQGNCQTLIDRAVYARDQLKADIIVFPELYLTGYPPEDLLLRPELHQRVQQAIRMIQQQIHGIYLIFGYPALVNDKMYNAAAIIHNGKILQTYYKQRLPNYSVFDEKRYFTAGNQPCVITIKDLAIGIVICEDLWQSGPLQQSVAAGAELIISLNASPFNLKKPKQREKMLVERQQQEGNVPIIYVNYVSGQDELIFDGNSMAFNSDGELCYRAPLYQEELCCLQVDYGVQTKIRKASIAAPLNEPAEIYQALVLGTHDYLIKNNFHGVLIGLSGGIDSALTAAIAVDAIGSENVHAVLMPSRYTTQMSIDDARELANNLGIHLSEISIEPNFSAFLTSLASEFSGYPSDLTEENLQARCRGTILMAMSNKFGKLVLTTGNKSEMAVGYATLYGDMAGGFAVIKDVLKTQVYQLANYRNSSKKIIPQRIIDRPPSAELAVNQTDQDSLPSYQILDPIIKRYVEQNESIETIVAAGFDETTVRLVINLIDRNEYKRRQAPPGIRISPRAFGRDWRYPITSGYHRRR